jgi:hypothetical protein
MTAGLEEMSGQERPPGNPGGPKAPNPGSLLPGRLCRALPPSGTSRNAISFASLCLLGLGGVTRHVTSRVTSIPLDGYWHSARDAGFSLPATGGKKSHADSRRHSEENATVEILEGSIPLSHQRGLDRLQPSCTLAQRKLLLATVISCTRAKNATSAPKKARSRRGPRLGRAARKVELGRQIACPYQEVHPSLTCVVHGRRVSHTVPGPAKA